MKFIVGRASKWFNEDVCCDEAKLDVITYNNIAMNVYSIEISTLEELMRFYDKYGNIIIKKNVFDGESMEILIYDDYIE